MPRLWNDTIEEHRQAVREAALDAVSSLIAEAGIPAVTMTKVAGQAGIARATLYKYYPDTEALLTAWHQRQIDKHLAHLETVRKQATDSGDEIHAVLEAYALMLHHRSAGEAPSFLHRNAHTSHAQMHLQDFIAELITHAAKARAVRTDLAPRELAAYALNALNAANFLASPSSVRALVTVVLDGLSPGSKNS